MTRRCFLERGKKYFKKKKKRPSSRVLAGFWTFFLLRLLGERPLKVSKKTSKVFFFACFSASPGALTCVDFPTSKRRSVSQKKTTWAAPGPTVLGPMPKTEGKGNLKSTFIWRVALNKRYEAILLCQLDDLRLIKKHIYLHFKRKTLLGVFRPSPSSLGMSSLKKTLGAWGPGHRRPFQGPGRRTCLWLGIASWHLTNNGYSPSGGVFAFCPFFLCFMILKRLD